MAETPMEVRTGPATHPTRLPTVGLPVVDPARGDVLVRCRPCPALGAWRYCCEVCGHQQKPLCDHALAAALQLARDLLGLDANGDTSGTVSAPGWAVDVKAFSPRRALMVVHRPKGHWVTVWWARGRLRPWRCSEHGRALVPRCEHVIAAADAFDEHLHRARAEGA